MAIASYSVYELSGPSGAGKTTAYNRLRSPGPSVRPLLRKVPGFVRKSGLFLVAFPVALFRLRSVVRAMHFNHFLRIAPRLLASLSWVESKYFLARCQAFVSQHPCVVDEGYVQWTHATGIKYREELPSQWAPLFLSHIPSNLGVLIFATDPAKSAERAFSRPAGPPEDLHDLLYGSTKNPQAQLTQFNRAFNQLEQICTSLGIPWAKVDIAEPQSDPRTLDQAIPRVPGRLGEPVK